MAKAPKCFCTAALLPNGICRYGCDPSLRSPGRRAIEARAKIPKEDRSYGLPSHGEVRAAATKIGLPKYRWHRKYGKKAGRRG